MMKTGAESLTQFYERTRQAIPGDLLNPTGSNGHFNIKRRCYFNKLSPYNRRDYYKLCLIIGTGYYEVQGEKFFVEGPAMIFSNPSLPSSWESLSEKQDGFYCLFNDDFLLQLPYIIKNKSALFNTSVNSLLTLDPISATRFDRYLSDMENLLSSDYSYKHDMIRSILQTLLYEEIRLQGNRNNTKDNTTPDLVGKFFKLLDQQFPVDCPENPLKLMSPATYAEQLNIHVNHLNAVLKKFTGKTTRKIIHEHIVNEAKNLLMNTNWDAAEIGYSLGFEYPSHFNKYFKQQTLSSPLSFRESRKYKTNL